MTLKDEIARKRELEQQLANLQKEIEDIQAKQKKPVLANIVELMNEFSISVDEVRTSFNQSAGGKRAGALGPAPIKYRHPETGQSWSGRGKAPRWLTNEEANGKSREEFFVG